MGEGRHEEAWIRASSHLDWEHFPNTTSLNLRKHCAPEMYFDLQNKDFKQLNVQIANQSIKTSLNKSIFQQSIIGRVWIEFSVMQGNASNYKLQQKLRFLNVNRHCVQLFSKFLQFDGLFCHWRCMTFSDCHWIVCFLLTMLTY